MPLVAAQCTNCGAALQVDDTKEAAVCQYCGTPFIVEKAIHNYEINNQYKIENANIILQDENSVEKRMDAAKQYLEQLQEYEKAYQIYSEIESLAPANFNMWYGKICSKTHNFNIEATTDIIVKEPDAFQSLQRDFDNAGRTVHTSQKADLYKQISTLLIGCKQRIQQISEAADQESNTTGLMQQEYDSQIADLKGQNYDLNKQINGLHRKQSLLKMLKTLFLILFIISVISGSIVTLFAIIAVIAAIDMKHSVGLFEFSLFAIGIVPAVCNFVIHRILKKKLQESLNYEQDKKAQMIANRMQAKENAVSIVNSKTDMHNYKAFADACQNYILELETIIQKYKQ